MSKHWSYINTILYHTRATSSCCWEIMCFVVLNGYSRKLGRYGVEYILLVPNSKALMGLTGPPRTGTVIALQTMNFTRELTPRALKQWSLCKQRSLFKAVRQWIGREGDIREFSAGAMDQQQHRLSNFLSIW